MKYIVWGNYDYSCYERSLCREAELMGLSVDKFKWNKYISSFELKFVSFLGPYCPSVFLSNVFFLFKIIRCRSKICVIWGSHYFPPLFFRLFRLLGVQTLISYSNDDPFNFSRTTSTPWYRSNHDKWLLASFSFFDRSFFYRPINLTEAISFGVSSPVLLPPSYDRFLDYRRDVLVKAGVCFVGHFEDDGRLDTLNYLAANGIKVSVYGGVGWEKCLQSNLFHANVTLFPPVFDDEYRSTLSNYKYCLCFLSKFNRDVYTRRCFEIPAIGSLLVSEYSKELESYFGNDSVILFRSKEHLLDVMLECDACSSSFQRRLSLSISRLNDLDADSRSFSKKLLGV